jgi:hypothetical protein
MMQHLKNLKNFQQSSPSRQGVSYEPKAVKTVTLGLIQEQFVAHKKLQSRAAPVIASKKAKVNPKLPKIDSKTVIGNRAPQNYWSYGTDDLQQKSCAIVIQTPEPEYPIRNAKPVPATTGSIYSE